MKKKDNFDMDLDMDVTEPAPKEKPFSFNDLDLGLDMDLSWLDDINEDTVAQEPKQEPVKAPPAKRPAPAAPAKKPMEPLQTTPKKPAASAQRPANGQRPPQRPANAQQGATPQRPAQRPASGQRPANAQPNASAKAPAKRPTPPPQQPETKKKKSGPRLGGVFFYTLYFMFILVFFLATFIGLTLVHNWLTDYEMAQPDGKAEQVFSQLFTNPDWGALYDAAGAKDSAYEGRDAYVTYMEDKVGDSQLNYLETSAGLSGNKKYLVRLEKEKVASFTLVDKAKNENEDMTNKFKNMSRIPDWQLGAVEVFFNREGTYYIEKLDGHTAYVNDVPLTDEMTIQVATTLAEKYLPEGTTGVSMCTQQIDGLMAQPTVTIFDKSVNHM